MRVTSTLPAQTTAQADGGTLDGLRAIEQRVLWLATAIVDHANRVRPNPQRAEGRRPPGVERVDGVDHDRAVVRASCAPATGCR